MRFWKRLSDPDSRVVRKRSIVKKATSLLSSSFGQRPMFSRPDDEDVTRSRSELPPESDLDPLVPTDLSPGNADEPTFAVDFASEDLDNLGTKSHNALTNVTTNQHHNESHTVASHNDTTATGTELETLTDGSGADALHTHAGSVMTGTPGGELGGTWASPTVDGTHSGSAHHAEVHATEHKPGGGDLINTLQFFNGTFIESFDALVTSNGATVTMSLEKSGGGDLTESFSSGQSTLDCTPAATIALTAGTDTVPVLNRVYILQSAPGTLVKTTGLWPAVEHIRVGVFLIPSAAFVQTYGAYTNHNLNDHASDTTTGQGHLTHITERIRNMGSQWISGCRGVATVDVAEAPDAVWVSMTAGVASQLHRHTFAALDTDPDGGNDIILVINQSGSPFEVIQDLATLTNDSTGAPLGANKYFAVVLWAVINKTGEFSPMGINLPSGTYNTLSDAQQDLQGYTDYSRPSGFGIESTLGFLVARFILKNSADMTLEDTLDLRGDTPETVGGGGGAGDVVAASPLTDNAIVYGDGGAKGVKTGGTHAASHTDGSDDIRDATDALKGIAKFNVLDFAMTSGQVNAGIQDSDQSHYILLRTTSDLNANRILNLVTGDAARTITLNGNPTLDNWFNQGVKVTDGPTFTGVSTDTISEKTGAAGVTVDSMLIKDGSTAGLVPIGGIVAWFKDLAGVPALPDAFVECNGQELDDPDSPLHEQDIPNLNGADLNPTKFLRGGTTSGVTGGAATVTLTENQMPRHTHEYTGPDLGGFVGTGISHVRTSSVKDTAVAGGDQAHSNVPPYTSVVWVMRVK